MLLLSYSKGDRAEYTGQAEVQGRRPEGMETMRIGEKVITEYGGALMSGIITGKHGSADYYAVQLWTGEIIYRYGADLEKK